MSLLAKTRNRSLIAGNHFGFLKFLSARIKRECVRILNWSSRESQDGESNRLTVNNDGTIYKEFYFGNFVRIGSKYIHNTTPGDRVEI